MKFSQSRTLHAAFAFLGLICLPAGQLTAAALCERDPVEVAARSIEERGLVCSAASDAIRLLGRCGIATRRSLHVELMPEVRHPLGTSILGLYDVRQQKVRITEEANLLPLISGTPYGKLPLRDFYRSLIVHEVIHGIMHQNLKKPPVSHAVYEYAAYALQIESLPSHLRERFLQSFETRAIRLDAIFSDAILMFDPYFFAAQAYSHLNASADYCANLNALLDGDAPFIFAMPLR